MLNGVNRFYSSHTLNPTYQTKKYISPYHFDVNRNVFPEFQKSNVYGYKPIMSRSPFVMRSNVTNLMPFSPYHSMQAVPQQNQLLLPSKSDQVSNTEKLCWPFDPAGEFCTDLINRDKHYWTDEETSLMLELYEENRDYFTDSRTKKTKVWSVIANMINKKYSTNINSEQCSQKYRNLKAEFLKLSESSPTETEKKTAKHFAQMKRLIEVEERSYLMQENNWQALDRMPNSKISTYQTMIISGNDDKHTPPNNNNNKSDTEDELKVDNQLNLPVMSGDCVPSVNTNNDSIVSTSDLDASASPDKLSVDMKMSSSSSIKTPPELLKEAENNAIDTLIGLEKQKNFYENSIGSNTSTPNDESDSPIEQKTYTKLDLPLKCDQNQQNPEHVASPVGQETKKTFTSEIAGIFDSYITTRNTMLESYELKEKENIKCMTRCVDIFYKVLKEKSQKV